MSNGYPYHSESAVTSHGSSSGTEARKPKNACSVYHCWETALYRVTYAEWGGAMRTQRCELHKTYTTGSVTEIVPLTED